MALGEPNRNLSASLAVLHSHRLSRTVTSANWHTRTNAACRNFRRWPAPIRDHGTIPRNTPLIRTLPSPLIQPSAGRPGISA